MGTFYRYLYVLVTIPLMVSACSSRDMDTQPSAGESLHYEKFLGKSINDVTILDWMTTNDCTSAAEFELCRDAGMAFWLDSEQIVKTIYLYLNNEAGFAPYKGPLPMGLKFYDTLGAVQYKIRSLEADGHISSGVMDDMYKGSSPDHMHYWVNYDPYNLTVIYNSPFPDEDATIYAILLHS